MTTSAVMSERKEKRALHLSALSFPRADPNPQTVIHLEHGSLTNPSHNLLLAPHRIRVRDSTPLHR